ncbi:MAG: zinc metallopeptidase [Chloroflexi bacterium]|nr:zinc metallopeptidase [Chloroflexota bacterium]
MFFLDPLWFLFAIPPLLVMFYAQHRVQSTYQRYAEVANAVGMSGAEIAARLLRAQGLSQVELEMSEGHLSDHYDPTSKTLRLSPDVYSASSVAALGIVAHEVGHALQDAQAYAPMQLRASLVPAVSFGSSLAPWLFLAGMFFQFVGLIWVAVIFFAGAVLFHLVTLPVELDASNRARALLQANGLVTVTEFEAADAVLKAAALTYLAALLQATAQLLYYVLAALGLSRRDE